MNGKKEGREGGKWIGRREEERKGRKDEWKEGRKKERNVVRKDGRKERWMKGIKKAGAAHRVVHVFSISFQIPGSHLVLRVRPQCRGDSALQPRQEHQRRPHRAQVPNSASDSASQRLAVAPQSVLSVTPRLTRPLQSVPGGNLRRLHLLLPVGELGGVSHVHGARLPSDRGRLQGRAPGALDAFIWMGSD